MAISSGEQPVNNRQNPFKSCSLCVSVSLSLTVSLSLSLLLFRFRRLRCDILLSMVLLSDIAAAVALCFWSYTQMRTSELVRVHTYKSVLHYNKCKKKSISQLFPHLYTHICICVDMWKVECNLWISLFHLQHQTIMFKAYFHLCLLVYCSWFILYT